MPSWLKFKGEPGTGKVFMAQSLKSNENWELVELPLAKPPEGIEVFRLISGPTAEELHEGEPYVAFTTEDGLVFYVYPHRVDLFHDWIVIGEYRGNNPGGPWPESWVKISYDSQTGKGIAVVAKTYYEATTHNPYGSSGLILGIQVLAMLVLRVKQLFYRQGDIVAFHDETEDKFLGK